MSFFTSRRERRLWLWTLAVVLGIYTTLGLARTLSGMLRQRGLLTGAFFLGMFLIGAAVVLLALRARPGGVEVGVGVGIAAVYLMVILRMGSPEERSHMIEYSVVALFIYEALKERAGNGRRVPYPAVLAVLATALVGSIDEGIQLLLPSRVFDPIDIGFNALAAFLAVSGSVALAWARRWRSRRHKDD